LTYVKICGISPSDILFIRETILTKVENLIGEIKMKKRFNLNQLEYLLESSDRNLDLEGSDITVNSLTSDTGLTVTAGGMEITAGNFVVTAGTTYLKGTGGVITYQGTEATTADSTAVITAANILTGIVKCTPTAAREKDIDSVANLLSGLSLGYDGASFDFSLINLATTGTYDITLDDVTNVTLVGNMIVSARDDTDNAVSVGSGMFRVRRTSATEVTIYRIS
jgi:hypothetical protein